VLGEDRRGRMFGAVDGGILGIGLKGVLERQDSMD
jgi:hypothetical protein